MQWWNGRFRRNIGREFGIYSEVSVIVSVEEVYGPWISVYLLTVSEVCASSALAAQLQYHDKADKRTASRTIAGRSVPITKSAFIIYNYLAV